MRRHTGNTNKEVVIDDFFAFASEDVIAGVSFAAFLAMSLIFVVILSL